MTGLDIAQEDAWTTTLGLSRFDLFGPGFATDLPGTHSVLLDGTSSFLFSISDDPALSVDEELSNLAWSSNLRHCVRLIPAFNELRILPTAEAHPTPRRFRTPTDRRGLTEVFRLIEDDRATDRQDVIRVALTAYRMLRQELRHLSDEKQVLRAFNSIMALREQVELGSITNSNFETLHDCIDAVARLGLDYLELPQIERSAEIQVGELLQGLDHGFGSNRRVSTHLLLRHASSELYQEAHLLLNEPTQYRFPGMARGEVENGRLRKDVRFTPSALARALTRETFEFAYRSELDLGANVRVLDPACGSGIFLKEALRELARRDSNAHAVIRGLDISDLSVVMSRFVVGRAASDAPFEVTVDITVDDALEAEWRMPHIVLMNPPFVQVENLDEAQRASASRVLGAAAAGRFDLSMAFIAKASTEIADAGVLTSLLPASLLETKSGEVWRAMLAGTCQIKLVGRFQGFNLFRSSTVEIGLVTLLRSLPNDDSQTMLLVAESNKEGAALRAIRLLQEGKSAGFELFTVPQRSVDAASWLPRSLWSLDLKKELSRLELPLVSEMFDVKQGIRTGANSIFILSDVQFRSLPEREQAWFRPTVGQGSVVGGAITSREYVFYPFDRSGVELRSEDDLVTHVPTFYETVLAPNRDALMQRARRTDDNWWRISEHRSWLVSPIPKLVSTYFGSSGSFSYDEVGDLAVVQGFGWLKKPVDQILDEEERIPWERSRAPFACMALLNSEFFQQALSLYCPRVQGGQFDLSPRYVDNVPIPDLSDEFRVPPDVSEALSDVGEMMSRREAVDRSRLEGLVRVAYGLG